MPDTQLPPGFYGNVLKTCSPHSDNFITGCMACVFRTGACLDEYMAFTFPALRLPFNSTSGFSAYTLKSIFSIHCLEAWIWGLKTRKPQNRHGKNRSRVINVLQPGTKGVPLKTINNSVLNFLYRITYKEQCYHCPVSVHSTLMTWGEATYWKGTAYRFASITSFSFIIKAMRQHL